MALQSLAQSIFSSPSLVHNALPAGARLLGVLNGKLQQQQQFKGLHSSPQPSQLQQVRNTLSLRVGFSTRGFAEQSCWHAVDSQSSSLAGGACCGTSSASDT
jgi:hypothetical protein